MVQKHFFTKILKNFGSKSCSSPNSSIFKYVLGVLEKIRTPTKIFSFKPKSFPKIGSLIHPTTTFHHLKHIPSIFIPKITKKFQTQKHIHPMVMTQNSHPNDSSTKIHVYHHQSYPNSYSKECIGIVNTKIWSKLRK